MGCSGAPARGGRRRSLALLNAGLTPVVPEHGSLGASGDLAPLAHCALALIGEGEVRDRDGEPAARAEALAAAGIEPLDADRQGGPGAHQRHRRHARHAAARARTTSSGCCAVADVTAAMTVEALLGTDRAFAADLRRAAPAARPGASAPPTCAGCSPARRSSPATATATRGSRTPTRCAARRRCTAPPATRWPTPGGGRRPSWLGDRQPDDPARRPGRVVRELPRRAARLRLRLPGDRRRRRRGDRRAPHRPPARPGRSQGLPPFLADGRRASTPG